MWKFETKRQGASNQIRVKFVGEKGIVTEGLRESSLRTLFFALGVTLFPNGTPVDSTFHVQNGNLEHVERLLPAV